MRKHEGFTIVEVMVVIVILGILLTVGVVSFRSTQVASRDREREADVKTIATYFENLYDRELKSGSLVIKKAGSYPSTPLVGTYYSSTFTDIPRGATSAPGYDAVSITRSTNVTENFPVSASNISPSPTKDMYVYLPINTNGASLCVNPANECRSFRIYYRSEADNQIKFVESKRK